MDKGLFIFVFIGFIAIYLSTNFIGSIQDDVNKESGTYSQGHQYEQYYTVDIVGDTVLNLEHVDFKKQLEVWNQSEFKAEFLELFPDFEGMKRYVDSKIVGRELKEKLLKKIDTVEVQFISGTLSGTQSKANLEAI